MAGWETDEFVRTDSGFDRLSDEELVAMAQDGDRYALEYIIAKYRRFVCSKIKTYFLIGAEDEDMIQEGMIGLYKAVRDFRPDRHSLFKTFASVCIRRQIITAIKTATRQKHIPLNSYVSLDKKMYDSKNDVTLIDTIVRGSSQDPETIIIDRENMSGIEYRINKALSKLELQVLVYYLEGCSYQEIAERIKKDVKSVDNAIQRIKKKMEAILKNQM